MKNNLCYLISALVFMGLSISTLADTKVKTLVDWTESTNKNPLFNATNGPFMACNVLARGPEASQTYYCAAGSFDFNTFAPLTRVYKIKISGHVEEFLTIPLVNQSANPSTTPVTWDLSDEGDEKLYVLHNQIVIPFFGGNIDDYLGESGIYVFDKQGNEVKRILAKNYDQDVGATPYVAPANGNISPWGIPTGIYVAKQNTAWHTKGSIYVIDCKTWQAYKLTPGGGSVDGHDWSLVRMGTDPSDLNPNPITTFGKAFSLNWNVLPIAPANFATGLNSIQVTEDERYMYTVNDDNGTVLRFDLSMQDQSNAAHMGQAEVIAAFDDATFEAVTLDEGKERLFVTGATEAGDVNLAKLSGKIFALDIRANHPLAGTPITDAKDGSGNFVDSRVKLLADNQDPRGGIHEDMLLTDNGKHLIFGTIDIRCFFQQPTPQIDPIAGSPDPNQCLGGQIRMLKSKVKFPPID